MQLSTSKEPFSKIAFLAIFVSLFLLFTPFEEANKTMFPKYLAAGLTILLLGPLVLFRKVCLTTPSLLVLLVLLAITFHALVAKPVPVQFALLIAANLALAILVYEARFNYREEFNAAAFCLLTINILAIVVQAGLFYFVTHAIYDIHRLLFGSESRSSSDFLNIARFSGIHAEPGTYTNYVSCLLAIYVFSSDANRKAMLVSVIAIFSVLLTHSASSLFFVSAMLLLFAWLWRARITPLQLLIVVAGIVYYVYASNFLDHLLTRFDGDDGSMSLKLLGINTYVQTSMDEKLIGLGFGNDPCTDCHYQDVGVVLNLISRGGIIVALSFALLLLRAIRLHGVILATLMFSIPVYCIISFYEAPIWIFILFAASSRKFLAKHHEIVARPTNASKFTFAPPSEIGTPNRSIGMREAVFATNNKDPHP